jgi:hypothetical protein
MLNGAGRLLRTRTDLQKPPEGPTPKRKRVRLCHPYAFIMQPLLSFSWWYGCSYALAFVAPGTIGFRYAAGGERRYADVAGPGFLAWLFTQRGHATATGRAADLLECSSIENARRQSEGVPCRRRRVEGSGDLSCRRFTNLLAARVYSTCRTLRRSRSAVSV